MSRIEIKNLSFTRRGQKMLDNCSFVAENGLTCIAGNAGAGKKSMFNCMLGLEKEESGEVLFDGMRLGEMKEQIGIIQSVPRLYQNMTGYTNMKILVPGLSSKEKICQELLVELGITGGLIYKKIRQLPSWQQYLINAVIAILRDPVYLLVEEPVEGLPQENWVRFSGMLRRIQRERDMTTLFFGNKHLNEVATLDPRLVVLKEGQTVYQGSMAELVERFPYKVEFDVIGDDSAVEETLRREHLLYRITGHNHYEFELPRLEAKEMLQNLEEQYIIEHAEIRRYSLEEAYILTAGGGL